VENRSFSKLIHQNRDFSALSVGLQSDTAGSFGIRKPKTRMQRVYKDTLVQATANPFSSARKFHHEEREGHEEQKDQ